MPSKTNDPNYLAQINAFHRFTQTYELSANAKLLWFMLMDLCNKCGWAQWFQLDAKRIMHWIGAKDVKTAYRARNALAKAGLLTYERGYKSSPSRYHLIFFPVKGCDETENISRPQSGIQSGIQSGTQNVRNEGHINKQKQNETKQNRAALLSAPADAKPREKIEYKTIVDMFNRICVSLPQVQSLGDKRKHAIRAVNQTVLDFGGWEKLFRTVEQSDFLTGRNGSWNGCGFDWILKPQNLVKIMEGNYADKPERKAETTYDGIYFGTTL